MSKKYKCMLCGEEFKSISNNHLSFIHNTTLKEYRKMFPDAEIHTKRVAWNKGVPMSEEHKQYLSKKQTKNYANGLKHWNTGNTTSEETKQKTRETYDKKFKQLHEQQHIARQRKKQDFEQNKSKLIDKLQNTKLDIQLTNTNSTLKRLQVIINHKEICKQNNLSLDSVAHNSGASLYYFVTCTVCDFQFKIKNQHLRPCNYETNICPQCFPKPKRTFTSIGEQELYTFLANNTSLKLIQNDRSVLGGKELDIFIPELNIGIEYSGLYWHSEQCHPSKYNLFDKYYLAQENNIRLITILEDEWLLKRDICEQRLLHILKQVKTNIPARKCVINSITFGESKAFLNQYHIQGADISSIRLGAWYNNELVAVMTFKPTNMTKGGNGTEIELSRYCVKFGNAATGLANKMFKYYLNNYPIHQVISYSDNRWNTGDLYKNLGFVYVDDTPVNYWYVKPNCLERFHRSVFMKHKLVEQGFDPLLTEHKIMDQRGYYRIWDCGSIKWKYCG